MLRRLLLPAAAVLAAAVLPGLAPAPAQADPLSSCEGGAGVIVVVDFAELGGGITKGCAASGDEAADVFGPAGYPLDYAQNSPGFVCRVAGKPSSDPCLDAAPASAFWSLWVSSPGSGEWAFAKKGVISQTVQAGGYVAFAWHQGGGAAAKPGVTPTSRIASSGSGTATTGTGAAGGAGSTSSSSTKTGSGGSRSTKSSPAPNRSSSAAAPSVLAPTSETTPTPATAAAPSSAAAAPTAPTTAPTAPSSSPSEPSEPSIEDLPEVERTTAEPADDGGGLPLWAGALIGLAALGAAVAVPVLRRRGA